MFIVFIYFFLEVFFLNEDWCAFDSSLNMCLNFLLHMKLYLDHLFDVDLFYYTSSITHSFVCENTFEFLFRSSMQLCKYCNICLLFFVIVEFAWIYPLKQKSVLFQVFVQFKILQKIS